jgi:hypothetical protein
MNLEKRLENIESLLVQIHAALESQGVIALSLPKILPNGMTEAQNDAAYKLAAERTVDGDRDALPRFLRAGGKVPIGKNFWPEVAPIRPGRPSGPRRARKAGDQ